MNQVQHYGFADAITEGRILKSEFLKQIDVLIDWIPVNQLLESSYKKGGSGTGRPAYPALLLFKMALLHTFYGLSDYEVEDQINDRLSFSKFIGLSLEHRAPDHSILSKFRTALTESKAYDALLNEINRQLEQHQIVVKTGIIIDASITDSPRCPRGKKMYEVVESKESKAEAKESKTEAKENELNSIIVQEVIPPHVDTAGRFVIKAGKIRFGFKKHTIVTEDEGLILGIITSPANVNEISNLEAVLNTVHLPKGIPCSTDKGYKSSKNDALLEEKGFVNQIMLKAKKNNPLTDAQKEFNKLISKVRYRVERTFGSIKRWFEGGKARYVGLEKTHAQHLMEAIGYNLYRSPRILMSKS